MSKKHDAYGTGFSGAKLVCAAKQDAGSFTPEQKTQLIDSVAWILERFSGSVYTGCDLHISTDDMAALSERTSYVLAALQNDRVCPNATTAHGVVGAVEAVFDFKLQGRKILVHGCGGVGSVVAQQLRDAGAQVHTIDALESRAAIDGCEPHAPDAAVLSMEWDAIVPCSASHLFTRERAIDLQCGAIVGATNLPFETVEAQRIAELKGVTFVPESVSSAGAVIGDSVEHYAPEAFASATPSEVYAFARHAVANKTAELVDKAAEMNQLPSSQAVLRAICPSADMDAPLGTHFTDWRASRRTVHAKVGATMAKLIVPSMMPAGVSPPAHAGAGKGLRTFARQLHQPRAAAALLGAAPRRHLSAKPTEAHDVVIAGAGIMGLNIAYQLKRRSPDLSVLVLERASSLGHGSSGYSTGFQRAYYSFDETMRLALDGMAAYKNWRAYLRSDAATETFTETGALWMLGKPKAENEQMKERLAAFGIGSTVLDAQDVKERFPVINTEPYPDYDEDGEERPQSLGEFSAVFEHGCGHVDPNVCLSDLLEVCRRDGVHVRFNQKVAAFNTSEDGSECTGVRTDDGVMIEAGTAVVNAAGPWFDKLMATAGVKMSTTALPTRIQVAHKSVPDEYLDLPFTADFWGPSGIYFMPRRANRQLVFGSVAHRFESEIVDPDECNPALDPEFRQDYLGCLLHRLPGLDPRGDVQGFSSMCALRLAPPRALAHTWALTRGSRPPPWSQVHRQPGRRAPHDRRDLRGQALGVQRLLGPRL